MSINLMDTRINYKDLELKWQTKWQNEQTYSSVPNDKPKFSLVMPPPNVTGVLHMGHALHPRRFKMPI